MDYFCMMFDVSETRTIFELKTSCLDTITVRPNSDLEVTQIIEKVVFKGKQILHRNCIVAYCEYRSKELWLHGAV
jgi:hypothetical protein